MTRRLAAALALVVAAACAVRPPREPPSLRVGTSGDYPPFSRRTDGGLDGLDVAVAERFAADTGRRLELVAFRWPDLAADLAGGRFDVAMGGVTMRPERTLVGTFTRPVAETGAVVVARPGVRPDAHGRRRLAVNAGGHLERVARRLFPHARVVAVADNLALPDLLAAGRVDAVLCDALEADRIAAAVPGARRSRPLTRDHKAYLARDPALAAELDAWLAAHERDGSLAALRGRWLGREAEPAAGLDSDVAALLALVDLRLSLMPAVALAKERLGRPTADPVQEARVVATARRQACEAGVDPERVDTLFTALIAAARAAQDAVRAVPAATRLPVDPIDLDGEARPALARLSALIVARAADVARRRGALADLDARRLADALDPALAGDADRVAIARGVLSLTPAETNHCL